MKESLQRHEGRYCSATDEGLLSSYINAEHTREALKAIESEIRRRGITPEVIKEFEKSEEEKHQSEIETRRTSIHSMVSGRQEVTVKARKVHMWTVAILILFLIIIYML